MAHAVRLQVCKCTSKKVAEVQVRFVEFAAGGSFTTGMGMGF
jgi:hypothetical protein